jgi:hypothetical protein
MRRSSRDDVQVDRAATSVPASSPHGCSTSTTLHPRIQLRNTLTQTHHLTASIRVVPSTSTGAVRYRLRGRQCRQQLGACMRATCRIPSSTSILRHPMPPYKTPMPAPVACLAQTPDKVLEEVQDWAVKPHTGDSHTVPLFNNSRPTKPRLPNWASSQVWPEGYVKSGPTTSSTRWFCCASSSQNTHT